MISEDLYGPTARYLRRLGPWVGAALLAVAAAAGWAHAHSRAPMASRWRLADLWVEGGFIYMAGALAALAVAMFVSGWPELTRSRPGPRLFARAEWLQMRFGHRIVGSIIWALLLLVGILTAFVLSFAVDDWFRIYYGSGLPEMLAIFSVFMTFALSGLVPLIVSVSTAAGIAASRRSGAARDLLLAPDAPDHFGWAVARSRARRGLLLMSAAFPYHCVSMVLLILEWRNYLDNSFVVPLLLLLLLAAIVEIAMVERCAALGVWLGSALRSPAGAAALAGVGTILLWALRLAGFGLGAVIAFEGFRRDGGAYMFWMWILIGCGWELVFFALFTPLLLWLTRGSLRAPLGMRLGAWMIRTGEKMSGLGEGDASDGVLPPTGEAKGGGAGAGGGKAWTVALWAAAFLVFLCFPLAGATAAEFRWGSAAGGAFFALYVVIAVVLIAVCWLAGRFVRRRIRAASETEAAR